MLIDLKLSIAKMPLIPKVTYRFNAIPNKILMTFFEETEKFILKFTRNLKGLQTDNLERKGQTWRTHTF